MQMHLPGADAEAVTVLCNTESGTVCQNDMGLAMEVTLLQLLRMVVSLDGIYEQLNKGRF